jgi:hypothetical protein
VTEWPVERVATIAEVCAALKRNSLDAAAELVEQRYPLSTKRETRVSISKRDYMRIFLRDAFVDRYTGHRLVFPPVLRVISEALPEQFPYQPHWKFGVCHTAYWELWPTVDHVVPVVRGGMHDMDNWVTTSMLTNQVKGHWTLEELGWELLPPGRLEEWDGLLRWFLEYVEAYQDVLGVEAVRAWHQIAVQTLSRGEAEVPGRE